jgi:hypothetical protein
MDMGIKKKKRKVRLLAKEEKDTKPVTLEQVIAALPKLIVLVKLVEEIEGRVSELECKDFDHLEARIADLENAGGCECECKTETEELRAKIEKAFRVAANEMEG